MDFFCCLECGEEERQIPTPFLQKGDQEVVFFGFFVSRIVAAKRCFSSFWPDPRKSWKFGFFWTCYRIVENDHSNLTKIKFCVEFGIRLVFKPSFRLFRDPPKTRFWEKCKKSTFFGKIWKIRKKKEFSIEKLFSDIFLIWGLFIRALFIKSKTVKKRHILVHFGDFFLPGKSGFGGPQLGVSKTLTESCRSAKNA